MNDTLLKLQVWPLDDLTLVKNVVFMAFRLFTVIVANLNLRST